MSMRRPRLYLAILSVVVDGSASQAVCPMALDQDKGIVAVNEMDENS